MVEEFHGIRHQSGSFSLIIVGSSFSLPAYFSLFLVSFLSRVMELQVGIRTSGREVSRYPTPKWLLFLD